MWLWIGVISRTMPVMVVAWMILCFWGMICTISYCKITIGH
jgi:hypothetical protein